MNPTEAYRAASAEPDGADSGPDDPRLLQAVEEYLAALEAGQAPSRDEFLGRHPAIAARLGDYLDGLELLHRAGPAAAPQADGDASAVDDRLGPEPLGDFLLMREVGRGGMGVVYEALQRSLHRRVALKVLPFASTMDPRQLQRFHNEVRAAASLDHPHIVHIYAVGCERGVHFYAMQFIEGQTLAALIADLRQRGGRPALAEAQPTTPHVPGQPEPASPTADTMPRAAASTERTPLDRAYFRRVAELGIQAGEALDHAHTLGIVHRDVKPANLLLDGRGGLWVTDFGLAHIQSDARLTLTGDLVGTLRYMSPEQALAKRVVVDHRTDVYSLGATLYELLTLEPAYAGSDRQELLRQIAFEEPRPPRRVNKGIPAELEMIVLKGLEKNPAERYATAKELAEDLRRFLADEPIRARPAGVVRRLQKWGRRHPAAVAAAAAALLVAVVLLSGGIGWVASDRASRVQRTADEINSALQESDDWQERRRVPEALAAARRAQAALAGGHADAELRRRVEARVFDLNLLASLEEARLELIPEKDGHLEGEFVDRRFGEIFRQFDLDVEAGSAEEAGRHIRDSTVALELASFLDDWSILRRRVDPQQEARWNRLLDFARRADPDGWRCKLRDALAGKDRQALVTLASSDEVAHLLPWTVSALAHALLLGGDGQPAEALLRKAQRQHPDNFGTNVALGLLLTKMNPPRFEEAILFQMVAVALHPQSPGAHSNLGNALRGKGDVDGAIAEYHEALRRKKDFAVAHTNLGVALHDKGDLDGAIAEYREALRIEKDWGEAHNKLGIALYDKGDLEGAIAEYREALRLKKDYAEAHANLGNALLDKGDVDGAIAEYQQALRINKHSALAHNGLGSALHDKGDVEGAVTQFHEALRIEKDFAPAHDNLCNALREKGDIDGAIAEGREALRLKKDYAEAHHNLGTALGAKGDVDGAIAELREALRLKKANAQAHYDLGIALTIKGVVEEAMAEYREALRLKQDYAEAHCNLGHLLRDRGQFVEALTLLRRGHELGSKNPRWPYPSAQWVKHCERLVELDAKLPKVFMGEIQPADVDERLALAQMCQLPCKSLHAAAVRFYTDAFAEQPKLADDLQGQHRYNAACAAALAGCGQGQDADQSDDKESDRLRRQAREWLRADLAAYRRLLEKEPDKAGSMVSQKMLHWQQDKDFDGVRDPEALSKLPEAERAEWRKLWTDVAATLARAQEKRKPEEKKASPAEGSKQD